MAFGGIPRGAPKAVHSSRQGLRKPSCLKHFKGSDGSCFPLRGHQLPSGVSQGVNNVTGQGPGRTLQRPHPVVVKVKAHAD